MTVSISGLTKRYERGGRTQEVVTALDGIDLSAEPGEMMVVVGPSGSGKTTLLRCIAGLELPQAGRVEIDGRDVTALPPGQRDIAMVFQDFALYPHLSVADNIAFGLRARKTAAQEIGRRTSRAALLLGLESVLERSPRELSGGERQRVALGRAIVRNPSVFLLDEPLSNLDAELRTRTRLEVRTLQKRLETTAIYVTHDQVEAMTMGDRVAVLREGRVEQIAPPSDLYDHPATGFVARFIGSPPMNLFPGELLGHAGVAGVRPEKVELGSPEGALLSGSIAAVESLGDVAIVHVDVGQQSVVAKISRAEVPAVGTRAGLNFSPEAVHHFESFDGAAL